MLTLHDIGLKNHTLDTLPRLKELRALSFSRTPEICIERARHVTRYLRDLDGCDADDVYEVVLREMEIPLFTEVLNHCEGNQSRAAAMLGIHRATLRKKLREYGLIESA